MVRIIVIGSLLLAAACATGPRLMSDAECASADWAAFGHQDGVAGAPPRLGNDRAAACHQRGYRMDRAAYDAGRSRGLSSFCAAPNAYRLGASGAPYRGQCAGFDEPGFTAEYERGFALFGFTDAVDRAAYRLVSLEAEREDVRAEIARLAGGGILDVPVPTAAARSAYLYQAERRLSDRDIPGAVRALALAERDLADYQFRDAQADAVIARR